MNHSKINPRKKQAVNPKAMGYAEQIRRLRTRLALYRKSNYKDTLQISILVDSLPLKARRYIRDMVFRVADVTRQSPRSNLAARA